MLAWNLSNYFPCMQASIINSHEYKSWREQGVAFELRSDSTYEVSNRSLASGLIIKKVTCRDSLIAKE